MQPIWGYFINVRNAHIFFDFSLTVKAAPHECVIEIGQS